MGAPLTGELCKITSVTPASAGTYDIEHLFETALRETTATYNQESDQEDVSGKGDGYQTFSQGLYTASLEFEGRWPRTAPRFGASGALTLGSSSAYLVEGWTLDIDYGAEEITALTGAAIAGRSYRPSGFPQISGSFTCRAESSAALSPPSALHATAENLTLKLTEDGAADPSFTITAGALLGKLRWQAGQRGLIKPTYDFKISGQLTSVAGSNIANILPAGVIDAADWDSNADGTPDMTVLFQTAASRTYSAAGFLRSLRIECVVNQVIKVSGTVQLCGTVTTA